MNDILRLTKNYSKGKHIELLPLKKNNILNSLVFLYDEKWEGQGDKYPYEILTYLLDCYYVLPERPDLASLFCWQAINHSYYNELLGDLSRRCSDTSGIKKLCENLLNSKNKYSPMLQLYLNRLPIKVFHYVASYMLKGYVIDKADIDRRYRASSFDSVKKNIPVIEEILEQSYGEAFYQITSPIIVNNSAKLNIESRNQNKSRQIIHSFALKLKELLLRRETYITFYNHPNTIKRFTFTDQDGIYFVLFGILYASRCNNFHGNVAARMNSVNADRETFKMYMDVFLTEYMILAMHMNSQGSLSDEVLDRIKYNANLML
ncbi:MAG: hypothetical protein ACI4E3_02655 [Candidatus Fimousia sp.]